MNNLVYTSLWLIIYGIILSGIGFAILVIVINKKRAKAEKLEEYNLTFLQIKVPPQNEIDISAAEQLFSSLMGFQRSFKEALFKGQYRISLEIVSKNSGIGFYVVVPDEIVSLVEKQINGAYPEAEIDIIDPNEVWDRGEFTAVTELKLAGQTFYPIKVSEGMKTDPMSLITSALSKLKEEEVIAIQYIISPANDNWRKSGQRFISDMQKRAEDPNKKFKLDSALVDAVEKKLSKPGFDVSVRITSIAADKFSADAHLRNVATSFEQFTDVKYNKFVRKNGNTKTLIDNFIYRKMNVKSFFIPIMDVSLYRNTSVLNVE